MVRVIPLFTHRLLRDEPITIYGGNDKTLDFTYVDDCVEGIARGIDALVEGLVGEHHVGQVVLALSHQLQQPASVGLPLLWGPHQWAWFRIG